MARLHVVGAAAELTDQIARWFGHGMLALPADITWTFQVQADPWFDAPGTGAAWQGETAIVPLADAGVRIAHPAGIDVLVQARGANATWRVAQDAIEDLLTELPTLAMLALLFGLRRLGWHHLHGATAVAPDGTGWLFTGPTGSGKSTTVAAVGRAGWQVGGDDAAFLTPGPGDAVLLQPWHGTVALREGGQRLLGLAATTDADQRGKHREAPAQRGYRAAPAFVPSVIAFCEVATDGGPTRVEPLARADAFARLITQTAWVTLEPALADSHLALLERLLRHASTLRLVVAPDLVDDPTRCLRLPGP